MRARANSAALAGTGAAAIAAERAGQGVVHHFNGKIERPRIADGGAGLDARSSRSARLRDAGGAIIAEWDFSIGIPTDIATDIGAGQGAWHAASICRRAR